MKQFYFKLINGEKILVSEEIFVKYMNYTNGDFYIVQTPVAKLYIQRSQIVLAYEMDIDNESI